MGHRWPVLSHYADNVQAIGDRERVKIISREVTS